MGGAFVQIINQATGLVIPKRADSRGRFYQVLLNPGIHTIRVAAPGFRTREVVQRLFITRTGEVVPAPAQLDLALNKTFAFTDRYKLAVRMDVFNVIDRDNFGIPVRYLEAPSFGQATETVTPGRRVQLSVKLHF